MTYQVQAAPSGSKGVDTITTFTAEMSANFKANGYSFVVRYLGALTTSEAQAILGAGLGLIAVGYSRAPGWMPSESEGASDGASAVANAKAAGLLPGMSLFCDLEGPSTSATSEDCISYVNAWASAIQAAGYIAGLYVGYDVPLSTEQLYEDLLVTAYWQSCSLPAAPAVRGYQMFQAYPPDQEVLGVEVDIDTIQADGKGATPMWMIAEVAQVAEEPVVKKILKLSPLTGFQIVNGNQKYVSTRQRRTQTARDFPLGR